MPYNEWDDNSTPLPLSLDAMRYELAKRGNMPLRADGSDVPYVASEVPSIRVPVQQKEPPRPTSSATNIVQALTDKFGITAIPQSILSLASGIGSIPISSAYGVYKGVTSPNFGTQAGVEEGKQASERLQQAMTYEPTSQAGKDINEGIAKAFEVSKLPPYIGHIPRARPILTPNDIRVMGANAKRVAGEVRDLKTDFANAQSGVRRQNAFGEPTLGVKAEAVASDIGDVLARRQAAGKSTVPYVSDFLPETNMFAVKPEKGGNWIAGSVEDSLHPLKTKMPEMFYDTPGQITQTEGNFIRYNYPNIDEGYKAYFRGTGQHSMDYGKDTWSWIKANHPEEYKALVEGKTPSHYLNNFVDKKIAPYIRNQMATPNDPVRELADKGVSHMPLSETQTSKPDTFMRREKAGLPKEGFAKTPLGKQWEMSSDEAIRSKSAGMHVKQGYSLTAFDIARWNLDRNPWLKDVSPDTPVYNAGSSDQMARGLGFDHLMDELRNAIRPDSDLPQHLRLKPESLDKVTLPQAVELVSKINSWRTARMEKAGVLSTQDFPISKEYPDQFKWIELAKPEKLPSGYKIIKDDLLGWQVYDRDGVEVKNSTKNSLGHQLYRAYSNEEEAIDAAKSNALETALDNEGEQMGHCVGGYCSAVESGAKRIFTLRDAKNKSHATIETSKQGKIPTDQLELGEHIGGDDAEGDQLFRNLEAVLREQGFENAADIAETEAFGNPHEDLAIRDAVNAAWPEAERRLEVLRPKLKNDEFNVEQIKGKGNGKVSEKYRTYIKDWLNTNHDSIIGKAKDLHNVDLVDTLDDISFEYAPFIKSQIERNELPRFITQKELEEAALKGFEEILATYQYKTKDGWINLGEHLNQTLPGRIADQQAAIRALLDTNSSAIRLTPISKKVIKAKAEPTRKFVPIINPNKRKFLKQGGAVHMNEGGTPTPEEARRIIAEMAEAKRLKDEATRPRTYAERLNDMYDSGQLKRPTPKGGAGLAPSIEPAGTSSIIKNPLNFKSGGGVSFADNYDAMRYELLRNQ